MSEWSFLKIDVWWKAVLVLGVLRTASSLIFPVDFINNKHLFGFGLGMILLVLPNGWLGKLYLKYIKVGYFLLKLSNIIMLAS